MKERYIQMKERYIQMKERSHTNEEEITYK